MYLYSISLYSFQNLFLIFLNAEIHIFLKSCNTQYITVDLQKVSKILRIFWRYTNIIRNLLLRNPS